MLINTDRHFKVLLANYICFNFSKFTPKKSQVANQQKNRSAKAGKLKSTKGEIKT